MPLTPTPGFLTTIESAFNVSETNLTASPQTVINYTAEGAGNYIVYIYYRITAETTLNLQLLWTSQTGPQVLNIVPAQRKGVGDVMLAPIYINVATNTPIYLAGSALASNQAYVSATVVNPIGITIPGTLVLAPNAITGLKSWLRSDLGVTTSGSRVTTWADQSGNSAGAFDPGTIGPTLNGSGTLGHPCLNFNGSQVLEWNLILPGAKTVIMVLKENGSPTSINSFLYWNIVANSGTGANSVIFQIWTGYVSTYNQVVVTYGDTSSTPSLACAYGGTSALPLAPHILYNSWNGVAPGVPSNYKSQIDHIAQSVVATSTNITATSGTVSTIGGGIIAGPTAQSTIQDDVYEVIVYNKVLSIVELIGLNNYLHARYGI